MLFCYKGSRFSTSNLRQGKNSQFVYMCESFTEETCTTCQPHNMCEPGCGIKKINFKMTTYPNLCTCIYDIS